MIEKYAFIAGWTLHGKAAGRTEAGVSSAAERFLGEPFDDCTCEMAVRPQKRPNRAARRGVDSLAAARAQ
jgi:hypothetical protein